MKNSGTLRTVRELRGLTQDELAGLINRTQKVVSAYEVGRRRPSAQVRKRIATILGAPEDQLFPQ